MIDLHLHTTASDGRCTPEQLVKRAGAAGVTVLSVTDHDTMAGVPAAAAAAAHEGLGFVPGIELTAVHEGRDVHVLGYYVDLHAPALAALAARQRAAREARAAEIGDRLAGAGAPVDMAALVAVQRGAGRSVARPRIAQALVEAGHVESVAEAFDRFLADGRPAYVPHRGVGPAEIVAVILESGGLASLAHPGELGRDDLIQPLVDAGLTAIEVFHSAHDDAARAHYGALARRLSLLVTGGSDYHGEGVRRAEWLGRVGLPPEDYTRLQQWRRAGGRGTRAGETAVGSATGSVASEHQAAALVHRERHDALSGDLAVDASDALELAHPAPEAPGQDLNPDDVSGEHGAAVAHAIDAHEEHQLVAVLGLGQHHDGADLRDGLRQDRGRQDETSVRLS